MHITPIKAFPHGRLGLLKAGEVLEVDEEEGRRLIRMGLVNPAAPVAPSYATKVVRQHPATPEVPGKADGEALPSSASPAAQASPQTTASESEPGKRKPGRPRKNAE
jgi:hypothetical protein